jgi:hypothetical protein
MNFIKGKIFGIKLNNKEKGVNQIVENCDVINDTVNNSD